MGLIRLQTSTASLLTATVQGYNYGIYHEGFTIASHEYACSSYDILFPFIIISRMSYWSYAQRRLTPYNLGTSNFQKEHMWNFFVALLNDVTMLRACLAKECSAPPFQATMAVQAHIYLRMSEHYLSLLHEAVGWDVISSYMCLVNRNPTISNTNFMTIYGCMASSQVLPHLWVFCMKTWSVHSRKQHTALEAAGLLRVLYGTI